jgi:YHS domain-containing protein
MRRPSGTATSANAYGLILKKEAIMKNVDPVCGMTVDATTAHKSRYEGREVLFCSSVCKQKFDVDPKRYAARPSADKSSR